MNRTDMNKQIRGYKAGGRPKGWKERDERSRKPDLKRSPKTIKDAALIASPLAATMGGAIARDMYKRGSLLPPDMVGGREGKNIVNTGGGWTNVTQFGKGKGPPKKNMKKGGKVKKSSRPRGCGIAKKGVRKAKYI